MAAYFRGWLDQTLTSVGDAFTLLPPTIALLVVGLDRPGFGMLDAGFLFGLLYGLGPATLVIRSRALAVVQKPFIDAARIAGARSRRIIGVHMLPHLLPYAGIQMMGAGIGALATVAFIQYLGATGDSRVGLGVDDLFRARYPTSPPIRVRELQHGGLPRQGWVDVDSVGRSGDDPDLGGVLSNRRREQGCHGSKGATSPAAPPS